MQDQQIQQGQQGQNSLAPIFQAIVSLHTEMQTVAHTNIGRTGNKEYTYAQLSAILKQVLPIIAAKGVTLSQPLVTIDGQTYVETIFVHVSGAMWLTGSTLVPHAPDIKKFGENVSYIRRYAAAAALGLATEKDTDGGSGLDSDKISEQQKQYLICLGKERGLSRERALGILGSFGFACTADVTEAKFGDVMNAFSQAEIAAPISAPPA